MTAPSLTEIFRTFARIGFLSFGGPAAQMSLMHHVLVDEKGWLKEREYLNALGFCMLLPGPEAMQLCTYAGWRIHGVIGGLIGGLLFVLPGAVVVLGMAMIYAWFGDVPFIESMFLGVKAAVLVIVVQALVKVSQRALNGTEHMLIAGLAFIGIFFLALPFPLIVIGAALWGMLRPGLPQPEDLATPKPVKKRGTLRTILIWLAIWWIPLFVIDQISGHPILTDIGLFFSRLAVVTFGGAYAVLAYMAQDVVNGFGWLSAGEMMDGLGLAETTPGPLILVTEFVGFLAAYKSEGPLIGILAALVTLWATFAPCFLWIFAGAPWIDHISAQPRLKGALSAITAAVVGVILNLSIWFALHVFFATVHHQEQGWLTLWLPELASLDWKVCILALLAAILLLWLKRGIALTLFVSVGGAVLLQYAG